MRYLSEVHKRKRVHAILSEVIFGLAWDGGYEKPLLTFFAFLIFSFSAVNSYFSFKNLVNENKNLTGGLKGGITAAFVLFALLFSFAMFFL